MTLEAHLSKAALSVKPDVPQYAQIVSVPAAAMVAGITLTVGLLIFALPFSDQIAISLSLLS